MYGTINTNITEKKQSGKNDGLYEWKLLKINLILGANNLINIRNCFIFFSE